MTTTLCSAAILAEACLARLAVALRGKQFAVPVLALARALLGEHPLREVLDHAEARAPTPKIQVEGGDLDRNHLPGLLAVAPDAAAVVGGIFECLLQV